MTFVVLSHFECIGAGSLLPEEHEIRSFVSHEDALAWFDNQWDSILISVTKESEVIRSAPLFEFESPYIAWVLMLTFTEAADPAISTLKLLENLFTAADESTIMASIEKYTGFSFDPTQEVYALSSVLRDLHEEYE